MIGAELRDRTGLGFGELPLADGWVQRAVRTRMEWTGIANEADYARLALGDDTEFGRLVNQVMPSVSARFFRYTEPWRAFAKLIREQLLPNFGGEGLRILSLPCSTGEEAYSIAISLLAAGFPPDGFKVDAVDVKSDRIRAAVENGYARERLEEVSPDLLTRFFVRDGEKFRVQAEAVDRVNFRADSVTRPGCLPDRPTYHVIFCQNLLIYLSAAAREVAKEHFKKAARPGCLFFVGIDASLWPELEIGNPYPWIGALRPPQGAGNRIADGVQKGIQGSISPGSCAAVG